MRLPFVMGVLVSVACSSGDGRESETSFGTVGGNACTPGEQQACACPGGAPDGVQVCAPTGDRFEECVGCEGGASDDTSPSSSEGVSSSGVESTTASNDGPMSSTDDGVDACAGHCSNGVQDCEEPFTDCGADCPETAEYTFCDCLIDTPRNGSEVCDDTGFDVPAESTPNVLVCLEATGGQIYVATNTSIDPDGVPRCSGWENMGQNAWDFLDYVGGPLTCDAVQKTQAFDISGYVGQTLWFGAHNHPAGGGSGTTACIAIEK
jgi:hypothetical protein